LSLFGLRETITTKDGVLKEILSGTIDMNAMVDRRGGDGMEPDELPGLTSFYP
jgi:hypothetical protein